ncbi:unnamed protein product [Candidula unifasciata]|uniref:Uracil-DNA glycosylase-like domain-containing protein n=1 Tax=Candidula unifasciata TaxID=100452 RepID=A0A8S3ZKA6_9EUPU|nr:unnamed protein product [Candidula unifasciata]
MSSSSSWDAYSQHTGLPASLEQYTHSFPSDMRGLAGSSASSGMSGLPGEGMLGYPKSSDLTAANLNLSSPYAAYGQPYAGMPDLGFSASSLRSSSNAHSPGAAADNLPASSPHGQYSSTPTSENQSSSPSFPNSTSLYTPSTVTSSISSSPYAQAFGGSTSSGDSSTRGPFSPFAQSYGYPMYGYNQVSGFPPSNSLEGVNRYMGGISSSPLMQSSAMGLYSNNQASQMPFPYHSPMSWGPPIPGFPLKESSDMVSQDELERYRYRQLSNPYFPGLSAGAPTGRNFPAHALQPAMMRSTPFLDDRTHSPPPKKPKKSAEEAERPPTPPPRDPSTFHSHRGVYLFTTNVEPGSPNYFCDKYVLLEKELCEKLSRVSLPGKIQYVYNPLEYAFDSHLNFVRRFCTGEKYVLFVGMNPGPFGMSQNGVPFGECSIVKEWLQIEGEVLKPVLEHPKRRIVGLECSRSEVTGARFWQLIRTLCHTPEHFFRTSYVHNLCPFAFLTDTGKNVTPPQLASSILDQINVLCNATLIEVVRLLKSKYVICVGKYALAQAQKALSGDEFSGITLECLMHPSPINPAANKGWADIAIKQLTEIGIIDVIRYGRPPYQTPSQPPSLSHPPHPPNSASSSSSSSSSVSQHSHSHLQYQNKQSPGHYGFQSPPVQSCHQGSNSHQSPAHAPAPSQSPAHGSSRSQSSPAHAPASVNQSSPAHSSCSQSPALQQGPATQSPTQTRGASSSTPHQGPADQPTDYQYIETRNGDKGNGNLESSGSSHEGQNFSQLSSNGIPAYSSDPVGHGHENGIHSHSDSGSQSSDISKGNSPSIPYSSGNPHANTSEAQHSHSTPSSHMSVPNSQLTSSGHMSAANQRMHHPMSSAHAHLGMSMPMSSSPGLQQTGSADHHVGLSGQQISSPQIHTPDPHMTSQNSHMGSMNSHMGSSMGGSMSMGSHMGMGVYGQMGSMNPYGQMEMGHMGGYGPCMSLGSYVGAPGVRPGSEMTGYGHHMGLHNSGMGMTMSGMHSGRHMASQMGMFNPHMGAMMGAAEHLSMHPGVNSMYDSHLGKEMPYNSHYTDKPPECS